MDYVLPYDHCVPIMVVKNMFHDCTFKKWFESNHAVPNYKQSDLFAEMLSARTSTVHFCSRLKKANPTGLSLPCSSGSIRNAEIDGPRQFRLSTFRTLAEKHGVY